MTYIEKDSMKISGSPISRLPSRMDSNAPCGAGRSSLERLAPRGQIGMRRGCQPRRKLQPAGRARRPREHLTGTCASFSGREIADRPETMTAACKGRARVEHASTATALTTAGHT